MEYIFYTLFPETECLKRTRERGAGIFSGKIKFS